MTVVAVDASGRLGEFHAVPQPLEEGKAKAEPDWAALFSAAQLPMETFTPVKPAIVPVVFADERKAWEGRVPEQPDHMIRVEAAAFEGRPVYFVVSGPWSRSARTPQSATPLFNLIINNIAMVVMPALMLAGVVLARGNVKLGRGDRHGAFRAASFLFLATLASWLLGASHTGYSRTGRVSDSSMPSAALCSSAGLLWLTYLGLEPYVRRSSPDSLIGWTRLLSGRFRDSRVALDVLIGVCAGLLMTVLYAAHNWLPPLFGFPEPVPISPNDRVLMGMRFVFSGMLAHVVDAISSAMLGMVGLVALRMLLRNWWLAALAGLIIYEPVVVQGMFPQGTPRLDLAIGAAITGMFILMIIRFGLLATVATLTTHFILLRAPLTTEIDPGADRSACGTWARIAVLGFGAAYIARTGGKSQLARFGAGTGSSAALEA